MNYDELSREEATDRLREHNEADWSDDRLWDEVIEPADVLYWLDAFGDLSLAINCQGLPKDLPDEVVKEVNEYDVYNDWQGEITESNCPICERGFYEFDFDAIYPVIDEFGDNHDYIEHVSDVGGYYWNATGDEHLMCHSCRCSPNFPLMDPRPKSGEVRIFYGERGEFSRFSHCGGVVRWDFEWDMDYDKSTHLYNFQTREGDDFIGGREIAKSFAEGKSSRNEMMERIGFRRLHVKEIDESVSGLRKFWRYAKEVLEGWATLDSESMTNEPTHPDLNFTYIIEGQFQAWIPEDCFEKFEAELVQQAFRKANKYEQAEKHREANEHLLSLQWEPA